MEFLLSVVSIGILCYVYGCLTLKLDYLKCFVCGLATFFCEYVLVSGILFFFDGFHIARTLWIQLVLNLGFLGLSIWKGSFSVESFRFKKYRLFLAVFVLLLPVSMNGFFGMGQDQGVYQVKTLFLMKDKTEKQIFYDEIDKLETKEEKEAFVEDVFRYAGYDKYDEGLWFNSEEDKINDTSGYFHGVQTFPALLAWSGTLFGVEHMMLCQMFFLFLFLAFISFVCDEITDREWVKLPVLLVAGFSPITLWVAKAALTEMFLALLFVMFFYFLKKGKGRTIWISLLPLLTYSFYHVTIYTMLPMFVCIYLLYFLKTGQRRYLYVGMANIAGFLVGFFTMLRVNPTYTTNNYFHGLGFLSFLNGRNLPVFVICICGIALLLHVCLLFVKKSKEEWINRFFGGKLFKILLLLFAAGCGLVIFLRRNGDLQHLTIVGYVMMSGFIMLPAIGGLFLWKFLREKDFMADTFKAAVFFGFLYAILLYSAVFRVEVDHYYYYGRYLLPYLPMIIFVFAYLAKKLRWYWLFGVVLFAGGFYVKYDALLYAEPDDTRLEWETLTGILENIEDEGKTAVFVDEEVGITYRLSVKGWTNADTYLVEDDLGEKLDAVLDNYDRIYYITQEEDVDLDEHIFQEKVRIVNEACEDLGLVGKTTKLPTEFVKRTNSQVLYEMAMPCYEYNMFAGEVNFPYSGFSDIDPTSAWMREEEADIVCNLRKCSYTLTVVQGSGIPFNELQREFTLEVYFNEHPAGSFALNEDDKGEFSMEIPEEWVEEGLNHVTLRMNDLWSPEELGAGDKRQLGFALSKLVFEKD